MKRGGRLERRTPLARTGPPGREPMRRGRSKAPELGEAFWQVQREALYARAGGRCEWDGCSLDSNGMHAHHRKLRSRGPDHALSNLAALAPGCHQRVHDQPALATARGFMVPSTADPALTAQQLPDGSWVHLTATGGYTPTEEPA